MALVPAGQPGVMTRLYREPSRCSTRVRGAGRPNEDPSPRRLQATSLEARAIRMVEGWQPGCWLPVVLVESPSRV